MLQVELIVWSRVADWVIVPELSASWLTLIIEVTPQRGAEASGAGPDVAPSCR
ncbi:hypothetical protein SALBM311S_04865 [Streptomyces alboniger]